MWRTGSQEAEGGARKQRRCDESWTLGVMYVTPPDQAMQRGELTGEPLGPREVQKTRPLAITAIRHMGDVPPGRRPHQSRGQVCRRQEGGQDAQVKIRRQGSEDK